MNLFLSMKRGINKKFLNLLPLNEEKNKLNPERMKSLFYTEKKSGNFVV